jgi:holliday junction DNA helicase RuvB
MSEMEKRLVTPQARPDENADPALRPQRLADFIGQEQLKENLEYPDHAARSAKNRWSTCCSTARPGWAKPPWRMCWPTRWA